MVKGGMAPIVDDGPYRTIKVNEGDLTGPKRTALVKAGAVENIGCLLSIDGGRVDNNARFTWLSPAEARAIASVLLTAAHELENGSD